MDAGKAACDDRRTAEQSRRQGGVFAAAAFAIVVVADYDKIRKDDRISLLGLADLAPGKPVECVIHHADGTTETLHLNHSFGESQLEWFRLGSALNLFHASGS